MYKKFSLFFCWLFSFQALANPLMDAKHMAQLLDKTVYESATNRVVFLRRDQLETVPNMDFDPFREDMEEHGGGGTTHQDSPYLKTPKIRALHAACHRILELTEASTEEEAPENPLFLGARDRSGVSLPYGLLRRDAYDALGEFVGAYENLKAHIDFHTLFQKYLYNMKMFRTMDTHGFQSLFFHEHEHAHATGEAMDEDGVGGVGGVGHGGGGKGGFSHGPIAFIAPTFGIYDYALSVGDVPDGYAAIQWANLGMLQKSLSETQGPLIGRYDNLWGRFAFPLPDGVLFDGYGFKINHLPIGHELDLERLNTLEGLQVQELDAAHCALTPLRFILERIHKVNLSSGINQLITPAYHTFRQNFDGTKFTYFKAFSEFSGLGLPYYMRAYGDVPRPLLLAFSSVFTPQESIGHLKALKISFPTRPDPALPSSDSESEDVAAAEEERESDGEEGDVEGYIPDGDEYTTPWPASTLAAPAASRPTPQHPLARFVESAPRGAAAEEEREGDGEGFISDADSSSGSEYEEVFETGGRRAPLIEEGAYDAADAGHAGRDTGMPEEKESHGESSDAGTVVERSAPSTHAMPAEGAASFYPKDEIDAHYGAYFDALYESIIAQLHAINEGRYALSSGTPVAFIDHSEARITYDGAKAKRRIVRAKRRSRRPMGLDDAGNAFPATGPQPGRAGFDSAGTAHRRTAFRSTLKRRAEPQAADAGASGGSDAVMAAKAMVPLSGDKTRGEKSSPFGAFSRH